MGWCLGGIMSLLVGGGRQDCRSRSISLIASPFDFEQVARWRRSASWPTSPAGAWSRRSTRRWAGRPRRSCRSASSSPAIDKLLTKPLTLAAQPRRPRVARAHRGRGRLHGEHARLPGSHVRPALPPVLPRERPCRRAHSLDDGETIALADVRVPVLWSRARATCWRRETAVEHVVDLLPSPPDVRFMTATGGHLGVLTGRGARGTTWKYLDEFLASASASDRGRASTPACARAASRCAS